MNGLEIFGTLATFLVIRFFVPLLLVVSIGNLLKKSQPA